MDNANTNSDKKVFLLPAYEKNSIPVVFAANNKFAPYFAVCLQSLIDNASEENNYDIVLIESDVTLDNKKMLVSMVSSYENITLRFYNANKLVIDYNLKANAHITKETYYRFLIQDILCGYDKVLYLDCDIIIKSDIADLFKIDTEGYMLAAARDVEFLGNLNGASRSIKKYAKEVLKMNNPYNYFQAGVILFNEAEMRKAYSLDEWLSFASKCYKYNDQDVLNIYCENRVKYIDMEWNFLTDCDHTRVSNIVVYAPGEIKEEYIKAANNPKIIHYAGHIKPWENPTEDKAIYFWEYAKKTIYYEELLFRMIKNLLRRQREYRLRYFADFIIPKGTKRREFVKKLIGK